MKTLIEGSWDDARAIASNAFTKLKSERLPVAHCIGRTLAVDAKSLVNLPTYATSAMDGYAVSGSGPWRIIGEVKAGLPMKTALESGQAVGIATGAVIPENTLVEKLSSINDIKSIPIYFIICLVNFFIFLQTKARS